MLEVKNINNYIKNVLNPALSSASLISQVISDLGAGKTITDPLKSIADFSGRVLRFTKPFSYLETQIATPATGSEGQAIITIDGKPVLIDSSLAEEGAIVEGLLKSVISIETASLSDFIKANGKLVTAAGLVDHEGKVYGAAIQISSKILLDYMVSFLQSYTAKLVKEDQFSVNKERIRFLSNVLMPTVHLASTLYNGSLNFRTIFACTTSIYSVANAIRSTYARLPLLNRIEEFKNIVLTSKDETKIDELEKLLKDKMKIDINKIIQDTKVVNERLSVLGKLKAQIEVNLSKLENGSEQHTKEIEKLQKCLSVTDSCQKIKDNCYKLKSIIGDETFTILENINQVRTLKKQGKVNYLTDCGMYPIESELLAGNIDAVKYLIANGADLELDSKIVEGTKLKELCEIIEKLEEKLGEVEFKFKEEELVSIIAQYANTENSEIVKQYLEKKFPNSVFEINREFEDLEKLEKRIALWEKIDSKSHVDGDKTLMEIAIASKRLDQVEYLLVKDSRLSAEQKKSLYFDPKNSQLKILQNSSKLCTEQEFKKKLNDLETKHTPARKRLFFI